MTTDEQLAAIVDSWLASTNASPHTAEETVDHVAARLPQTRQRSRWWRLLSFQRTTTHPADKPSTDYNAISIPASNGQSATVTRRTQSMFSPAKAITAGALVFAIGGVLLIAQPFDQRGGGVPGAATDAEFVAPVEVTGTLLQDTCGRTRQEGDETTLPGADEQYTCTALWSMSDSRLDGVITHVNDNFYLVGNGLETSETLGAACVEDAECEVPYLETVSSSLLIENDDGVWRQRPTVKLWYPGVTDPDKTVVVLDGEGGYEGLVTVLEVPDFEDGTTYYGFILDARQLKPAPENASTT
jgi:hypothetical protein